MLIKAYAKINLGLKVLFKRDDGYHEIETVMQEIGLCDYLKFEEFTGDCIEVECIGMDIPSGENLVYKAAQELSVWNNNTAGVKIYLYKNIPAGAGLGGGSSDAAATILALNDIWKLGLTQNQLVQIAANLGADVPFFLYGGTALARGKGEQIIELPAMPFWGVVLAKPPELFTSTGKIYARVTPGASYSFNYDPLLVSLKGGDRKGIWEWMKQNNLNMLEEVVLRDYPELNVLKEYFMQMGLIPILSGSGPTVFAFTRTYQEAMESARCLENKGYDAWACWTN